MVKHSLLLALAITSTVAFAAEKKYFEFDTATGVPDNARIPMYDPASGSKNLTGLKLKELISGSLPIICDGPDGPVGPANSLAIGSFAILDAYSTAFANISGTAPNQYLNMGIPRGYNGQGVPTGGTTGQRLVKKSNTDYDTEWQTPGAIMVGFGDLTGVPSDNTALQSALNAKEPANSNIQAHIGATNNPHATTINQVAPTQAGNAGKVLGTNGSNVSWVTGGSGTPGGGNKSIQYNNGGAFGGFGRYSSGCLIL